MALQYKTVGFSRGEVVLDANGNFSSCSAYKRVGIWDTELNNWAQIPSDVYDGQKTLQQLKNFVANLT